MTGRADNLRVRPEQMVQHGYIVRRQVPDDIDVFLEDAQVDPGDRHVEDLAQFTVVHQFADLAYRGCEQEGVADHDLQLLLRGDAIQGSALVGGGGHRFFDKQVFAGLEDFHAEREMCRDGSGHHNGIDGRVVDDLAVVGGFPGQRIQCTDVFEPDRIEIRNAHQFNVRQVVEIPDEIGSPVPTTDDCHSEHYLFPFASGISRPAVYVPCRASCCVPIASSIIA